MIHSKMADLRTIKPRSNWEMINHIFVNIYENENVDQLNGVVNLPVYLLN